MKSKDVQGDFHIQALKWKAILQETEELLNSIEKKLVYSLFQEHIFDDKEAHQRLFKTASNCSKQIIHLKQRISKFENHLSIIKECDTTNRDTTFLKDAKDISFQLNMSSYKVILLTLEIDQYTDLTISD